ncbi:MAG: undecaprenyl/decaprenyl-phosphate alpha-N-acetylglucosaminyl 1-phosphate transferase [Prevotellaceae bacterium]|jgi:UDP-N-acetylmuramyl pentapeptide phosphotransferase/UDP-N-acetylglucosamine-1-phosphate transferase|nr:undecaprenyl/decaprenyl-phosphate alpha-N-acetylglucosaminyl 1-phosphate transferase [Prevotellaceae bacterium]
MSIFFYACITALLCSFLLMPLLARFLRRRQIMDEGGHRRIHRGLVPSMGGIIICVAFLFAILMWMPIHSIIERRFELAAISLIFFSGIRDDMAPLRPLYKLVIQIVAAIIIVLVGNICIPSLYGLFGIYQIPEVLGCALSILFIILVTNAFNLIDGIDGLAAVIAITAFAFLGIWFFLVGNVVEALRMACIIGAIGGFLYYNWQPASIFMGDTGSLVVGFILSTSALSFITFNGDLPAGSPFKFPAVFGTGLAVVLLPLFDTVRIFLLRMKQGKSPFLPDKQHLHHVVLHAVRTHAKTVRVILAGYIIVAGSIIVAGKFYRDWIILTGGILVCITVDLLLARNIGKWIRKYGGRQAAH